MERKQRQRNLVHRLVQQYLVTLIASAGMLVVLVYFAWWMCTSHIWYGNEFWYPLFHAIHQNLTAAVVIVCLFVWLVVTIIFAARMWLYLREVIRAAEHMALYMERPVRMSIALKEVQDELNSVREQVKYNEKLAREAEQRKSDLIVYLAHDLKTPLTSVIGYLTLLRDEPDISPQLRARYTGIAYDKAERLEQLVNEFFDITRFNLTEIVLEKRTIDLSRMLEQMTSEFLPILEEAHLHWKLSIQPDVQILCDPDKLERVFDNLIRNAVFYCYPESEITFHMSVEGTYAWVRIENPGRTIPKEKLSRIFEQFFRMDEARGTSSGGAGLGLAIAKEIVELHGGHIEAESADEHVAFCVWLPVN